MAPMTRCFSPSGVPGENVAQYYRRRARHGVGLMLTEATAVPHIGAASDDQAPNFYGDKALEGWKRVVNAVHGEGGRIIPQLAHNGLMKRPRLEGIFSSECGLDRSLHLGPSGIAGGQGYPLEPGYRAMSRRDIDAVIEAYAVAASWAYEIGFDGVEIHAAHGYLPDQFLWDRTNSRRDAYGGDPVKRTRFLSEIIAEIRVRVPADFPVLVRLSQWKVHDYEAVIAENPSELQAILRPLVEAGVDIFDCSQRRYWEPLFAGDSRNLAGWIKALTGRPTITVGSVTLTEDTLSMLDGKATERAGIKPLLDRMARDEFDLVAIGRALIADPDWIARMTAGGVSALSPFSPALLADLR